MSATKTTQKRSSSKRGKKPDDPLAGLTYERTPYPSDADTNGWDVIRWIETLCVFPEGPRQGQPARLEVWQKLWILQLFAVGDDLRRIYRWCLLGVPKKNGKSTLAAWLALYFCIGSGEPNPLVICAAAGENQADVVFGLTAKVAELSPALHAVTERYTREITVPSIPGAKIRRVASAKGRLDGLNVYVLITDELHQWVEPASREVWTVLTNATGARREPLVIQITTAGSDLDTVCGEQYELGRRTVKDPAVDPRFFFMWFAAPEGADHRDPAVWRACNPSWGVTLPTPGEFFADQLIKKTESEFRRFYCNEWTTQETIWVSSPVWDACQSKLTLVEDAPTWVGIDVGLTHDSSGIVVVQRRGDRTIARVKIWENPYPKDHSRYGEWRFDIAEAENHLRSLFEQYPAPTVTIDGRLRPGPGFFYDPHYFERSAQTLEGDGLAMVDFPQSTSRMVPASQTLYELVVTGQLAHDGDEDLKRHVMSAIAQETPRGWRLSKPRGSRKRIDGAIALAIAVFNAHQPREEPEAAPTPGFHAWDDDEENQ